MDKLTQEQARALWEAGSFFILANLPQGSEYGIDGTVHVVRQFSGTKFIPPGLHFATWSASTPSPSGMPHKAGLVRVFKPKERVVFAYDAALEEAREVADLITDDRLRALDKELASYPFEGLERWKTLTTHVTSAIVETVLLRGHVDDMMAADGDEGAAGAKSVMRFPVFDLKRSWRPDAIGEEVTRYSRDKSWLLGHVAGAGGRECNRIATHAEPLAASVLAHFQLSFVIFLHLSSFSALGVYRRFLPLFTRSALALLDPATYVSVSATSLYRTYVAFISTLAAHLEALPDHAFDVELPEMDVFYIEEIELLRLNLAASLHAGKWASLEGDLMSAWDKLRSAGRRWSWDIAALDIEASADDSDEEGEYAPVVVDT